MPKECSVPLLEKRQLSALAFQSGAIAGGCAMATAATTVNAAGLVVAAAIPAGFVAGGVLGWGSVAPFLSHVSGRLTPRRAQTMLVSVVACTSAVLFAIAAVNVLVGTPVSLLEPVLCGLSVAILFGVQGSGP